MTTTTISKPLRVYVIEPQVLLAKALCGVLAQDGSISIAGDSERFEPQRLAQSNPDLIVIDCDGDLARIQETIAACRAAVEGVHVCILSSHLNAEVMLRALSAGADGYVLKDVTPSELIASIKAIGSDGFYADPRLSSFLLRRHAQRDIMELSRRELEVVRLIAEGLSNKEISDRLLLSDKTVKNHIANIFAKLNVNARTQVAVYAVRNGMA